MRPLVDYQQIRLVTNAEDSDFLEIRPPERLQADLPKLHADALRGKPKVIETLKKHIHNFQKYPVYKNLLYLAYSSSNNHRAAEQVAEQMYRMHPEYVYARANYAESLLRHPNEVERAREVLHPSLNITEAFPGRKSFHFGEFIVYERSVIMYLAQTGAAEEATMHLNMVADTGFAPPELLNALRLFIGTHQPFAPVLPPLQTPHLAALYFAGSWMTAEVMREILQQPRETLIADLGRLLDDLIDRADYWQNKDFPPYVSYTPLHVLLLLAELEAEEMVPTLLRFLRQPNDVVEHWFGDFITELLPEVMARFATPAQDEWLADFSTDQSIDAFVSNSGVMTVVHRADRQPELREPAIQWLEAVIHQFMSTAVPGDANEHLNLAVAAIIDLKADTLLPLAKESFERDLLNEMVVGDYAEFADYVTEEDRWPLTKHYTDLEEAYDFIRGFDHKAFTAPPPSQADNPWLRQIAIAATKKRVEEEEDRENNGKPGPPPQSAREHVSLNAPCPCGSGKKYKRCHGQGE